MPSFHRLRFQVVSSWTLQVVLPCRSLEKIYEKLVGSQLSVMNISQSLIKYRLQLLLSSYKLSLRCRYRDTVRGPRSMWKRTFAWRRPPIDLFTRANTAGHAASGMALLATSDLPDLLRSKKC